MGFLIGDKVGFSNGYNGYFNQEKKLGLVFTVKATFKKDNSTSQDCVQLEEIKEIHLIGVDGLIKAKAGR